MCAEPFDELRPPVSLGAQKRLGVETRSWSSRQSREKMNRAESQLGIQSKRATVNAVENYNRINRWERVNGINRAQR